MRLGPLVEKLLSRPVTDAVAGTKYYREALRECTDIEYLLEHENRRVGLRLIRTEARRRGLLP